MSVLEYSIPDDLPRVGTVVACGTADTMVYQKFVRAEDKLFLCVDFRNSYGGVTCRWYNIRRFTDSEKGVE